MIAAVSRRGALLCLALLFFVFCDKCTSIKFSFNVNNEPLPKDDPYKVLGIKFTAADAEVQKAYRNKARETHPDKNPSPNANEEFTRVKAAYDILGNPASRKRHDAKVRQDIQRRRREKEQERKREEAQRQKNERAKRERKRKMKEMTDKSRATHRNMVQITTFEEFEKQILVVDDSANKKKNKVYGMHCLIMFVANKNAEKKGEGEIHFPYPFAGEPGQSNTYQNMLKVAKVRFNTQTDLTRLFRAKSQSDTPHIIFARKGDPVGKFQVFHINKHSKDLHGDFKKWATSLLVVEATIANHHSLPVELLVIRDGRVVYNDSLGPEYERTLALQAGDRIMAFDSRLDSFPGGTGKNPARIAKTKGVLLMDEDATSSKMYHIERRRCYDLSTQCNDWVMTSRGKRNQQCNTNPEFMHNICPYTCGVCSESFTSNIGYYAHHYPILSFPPILQNVVRSGRLLADDIVSIFRLRKNAAAVFFALGLLVAFNVAYYQSAMRAPASMKQSTKDAISNYEPGVDLLLMFFAMAMCAGMEWMALISMQEVPAWLRAFHFDFTVVTRVTGITAMLFGIGVLASCYLRSLHISYVNNGGMNFRRALFFIALLLTMAGAVLATALFMMSSNAVLARQWHHLWTFRKNAAVAIFMVGASAGVGLVSIARLAMPLLDTPILPAILFNILVLAAVVGLASMDSHFKNDLMHVLSVRKNAAFGFGVFGALIGHVVLEFLYKTA